MARGISLHTHTHTHRLPYHLQVDGSTASSSALAPSETIAFEASRVSGRWGVRGHVLVHVAAECVMAPVRL